MSLRQGTALREPLVPLSRRCLVGEFEDRGDSHGSDPGRVSSLEQLMFQMVQAQPSRLDEHEGRGDVQRLGLAPGCDNRGHGVPVGHRPFVGFPQEPIDAGRVPLIQVLPGGRHHVWIGSRSIHAILTLLVLLSGHAQDRRSAGHLSIEA